MKVLVLNCLCKRIGSHEFHGIIHANVQGKENCSELLDSFISGNARGLCVCMKNRENQNIAARTKRLTLQ